MAIPDQDSPHSPASRPSPPGHDSHDRRPARAPLRQALYAWEGKDRHGRPVRGELRGGGAAMVSVALRRQGIAVTRVGRKAGGAGRRVSARDVALLTRQLATMLQAGVPLLLAFDVLGQGHAKPAVAALVRDLRADIESGTSLQQAFRQFPQHFDALYCDLVGAGEQAGMLDDLLARLARHQEKALALRAKLRAAMMYPLAIVAVAFAAMAVIMVWVMPAFKDVFASFGAALPEPTLLVIALSDFLVQWWHLALAAALGGAALLRLAWRRCAGWRRRADRALLRVPALGGVIRKAAIARWSRTLSTMFAAGVPLVESLDAVGAAAGNALYLDATRQIQRAVSSGTSLTAAMRQAGVFPHMVTQLVAIGEQAGALDAMLAKVADVFEQEVDEAVGVLASLMEPLIMVVLGVLVGALVVAMYLPIFRLGSVL